MIKEMKMEVLTKYVTIKEYCLMSNKSISDEEKAEIFTKYGRIITDYVNNKILFNEAILLLAKEP